MFISRLNKWLDDVDPYYTQRIILHKGLYLATWLTFFNWIARPDIFTAYCATPMLLAGFIDAPALNTFREKDKFIVTTFMISGFGTVTFYLMYPFKFFFLFYAILFLLALHYFTTKYAPKIKPFIMTCIVASALNISTTPPGSIQIAYDMFFCVMLGLLVTFFAFKFYPNPYRRVWHKALVLYVGCVNQEITKALRHIDNDSFIAGVNHLNTIRLYRHLLPKQNLINFVKVIRSVRDISLALTHILQYDTDKDFWHTYQNHFTNFENALKTKQICKILEPITDTNFDHLYVHNKLNEAILNWNKICTLV